MDLIKRDIGRLDFRIINDEVKKGKKNYTLIK